MNWYKKAQNYNQEIINRADFVGFHCQKRPRSEYDDIIVLNDGYADEFYIDILDGLPHSIKDEAYSLNLLEKPEKYTDEFSEWAEKCYEFFKAHNIRWIFVSETKTLHQQYGEFCYYVLLNKNSINNIIVDVNVQDRAAAYVYEANKITPSCILVEDMDI